MRRVLSHQLVEAVVDVVVKGVIEPMSQSMLRVRDIVSSARPMWAAAIVGIGVMQVPAPRDDSLQAARSFAGEARTALLPQQSSSTTLKTGVFKNGMRYYIQANPFPAKRAAIWLAVNAGSIQEDDDQVGYAHFLEHMAFNGTRKFPGNSLIDVIEQSGMTFGADLNAYTSFDETVYQLTVPTDDAKLVENGLDIIHEWAAGAILLDSADVIMERGVVLGEWRQRLMDTIPVRLFQDYVSRTMGGANKYIHRLPIGTSQSVGQATAAPLRRFYRDWYRPDLMAVIIVGDIDPERMYEEVKQRFERIPAAKKRPFQRPVVQPEARSAVHVVKDLVNPKVVVQWPNPIRGTTAEDRVKEQVTYSILLQHLNEMFSRLSKEERRPFAYARLSIESGMVRPLGTQLELTLAMEPDSAQFSLGYALGEIERVVQYGIPEKDLELAKSAEARRLLRAVDGLQHIPSRTLAERYVSNFFDSNELLITSEQRNEIGSWLLKTLSNADIQKAATFWKQAVDRSVSVEIPKFANVRVPTEAEIRAIFEEGRAREHIQAHTRPAGAAVAQGKESNMLAMTSVAAALPSAVASEAVVSEIVDDASGVVVWKLSNGARVVFKATANNPDEVILHAISPGGYSKLPDSLRLSSGRLIADLMTSSGNAEPGDHAKYIQRLVTMGVTQFAVVLSGLREEMIVSGSSRNPSILFSTMNRQFVDPYIDPTAFSQWKRSGMRSVTYSNEDQLLYALTGDRRFAPPSVISVPLTNLQKGMEVYRDRFGDASDFTFYIVGAISRDSAKSLAGQYLSTLPSTHRSAPETLISTKARSIKGVMSGKMEHPQLQAVQAAAAINFGGYLPQRYDSVQLERKRLDAVALVLGRRLRNKLREEMAVTYGVTVAPTVIEIPDWYYTVGINFIASPDDVHRSVDSTWRVIRELQSSGPTPEELAMAATIQQRRRENLRESNGWWVLALSQYDRMGAPFAMLAEVATPMDPEEFKAAMKRLFSEESHSQNIVIPTKETLDKKAREDKAKAEKAKP